MLIADDHPLVGTEQGKALRNHLNGFGQLRPGGFGFGVGDSQQNIGFRKHFARALQICALALHLSFQTRSQLKLVIGSFGGISGLFRPPHKRGNDAFQPGVARFQGLRRIENIQFRLPHRMSSIPAASVLVRMPA